METSLKTGFAQIFSCCPKNLSCPKFGGAAAPLAPPARTPVFDKSSDEEMSEMSSQEYPVRVEKKITGKGGGKLTPPATKKVANAIS